MVFKNKLQYRIILLVFVILVVIGLIGDGIMLYLQRRTTVAHFTESTVVLAAALRDSLERDMLLPDRQHVQKSVELMASRKPVTDVTVISNERKVFASSDASAIGQIRVDKELTPVFTSGETITRTGNNNLYIALPVLNKPDCYGCHGSGPQILGAIKIGMDSQSLDKQLQEQTLIMVVIAGVTLLIIGVTLTYMFRSSVVNPILKLIASARRIAGGDLSARVEIQRDDEVGMMARSFNEMAERVEQNARALEASKMELE
ncbi:MAG: HAMP domain-containing protein, partial [Chloroflexota bacterium]